MPLTTNKGISRLTLCLSLIFIATGIERFWGNFAGIPTFAKILFSCLIYSSFLLYPYKRILHNKNEFYKSGYFLLILLLLFIPIGLIQGLNYHGIILGNKYATLFFNETAWMLLFPPLFAFLAFSSQIWRQMRKLFFIYAIYAVICLLMGKIHISYSLTPLIPIFFYYSKGGKRILLICTFFGVLLAGILSTRSALILSAFAMVSIIYSYLNIRTNYLKIFVLSIFLLPFLLLIYSVSNQTSVFEQLSDYSSDEDMTSDTRTFLYTELAEDLTATNSWITGKSVIGRYYSPYFSYNTGGDYMWRSNNEVTILNFLLKTGFIYVIIYLLVFILAILIAINKGQNRFVKSIAIMLSGIYFNLFIGDIQGCNLFHLCYWLMIGTCFSKKWLNMTDQEVKTYFTGTKQINNKSL